MRHKTISQPFECMNNKVLHNNQKPVSERQIPTHINTIREKEVKKAAEIKNITLSGQTIVENTSENSAVEPEKHCVQLDSGKVTTMKIIIRLQLVQE